MTKLIPLTRGLFTLVDDEDFESLTRARWHARVGRTGDIYAARSVGGRSHRAYCYIHRDILGLTPDNQERVDHINDDPLDNRRCNLRLASQSDNIANGPRRKVARSGYRGVQRAHGSDNWIARITVQYRGINLGTFPTAFEAAMAYDAAAVKFRGEFARLNIPQSGTSDSLAGRIDDVLGRRA